MATHRRFGCLGAWRAVEFRVERVGAKGGASPGTPKNGLAGVLAELTGQSLPEIQKSADLQILSLQQSLFISAAFWQRLAGQGEAQEVYLDELPKLRSPWVSVLQPILHPHRAGNSADFQAPPVLFLAPHSKAISYYFNDRPPGEGRNAHVGPRFEVMAEAFNLANHPTFSRSENRQTSINFGKFVSISR